jgi:hypothetical protein
MTAYAPLPGESSKAFAAFVIYRDMGETRSVRAVGRVLDKSRQTVGRWSSEHHWPARIRSIAANISKTTEASETKLLTSKAGVWAERALEMREAQWAVSNLLMEKARAMLKWPLARTTTEDGKTIVHPSKWALGDAARMVDVACKLQCLATGQPTGDGNTTNVTVNVPLTLDQKAARMREIFGLSNP